MKGDSKENLNKVLNTGGNNSFKDLPMKMQVSSVVLSKDLRTLKSLNKLRVGNFCSEHYPKQFFL